MSKKLELNIDQSQSVDKMNITDDGKAGKIKGEEQKV